MNKDYIEGFMDGHAEGMAAGFNLMEKSKPVPSKTEPREFWITLKNNGVFTYVGNREESAANYSGEIIKVREVIDEP